MGMIPGMGKMMKQMQGAQPSEKEMAAYRGDHQCHDP